MDLNTILELTWVPVIVFGICLGYGIILLTTQDPKILISKKVPNKGIKDRKKYAVESGKLLIFMAVGSLLMCALLFVNVIVAFVEIILWTIMFGLQWRKVSAIYGPM